MMACHITLCLEPAEKRIRIYRQGHGLFKVVNLCKTHRAELKRELRSLEDYYVEEEKP